jgi:hypothetical protein
LPSLLPGVQARERRLDLLQEPLLLVEALAELLGLRARLVGVGPRGLGADASLLGNRARLLGGPAVRLDLVAQLLGDEPLLLGGLPTGRLSL